jgi:hypothetical protein
MAWICSIAFENQETSDVNKPLCVISQMRHGSRSDYTVCLLPLQMQPATPTPAVNVPFVHS